MVQVAIQVRGTSQVSRTAQWGTMTSSGDVTASDHLWRQARSDKEKTSRDSENHSRDEL